MKDLFKIYIIIVVLCFFAASCAIKYVNKDGKPVPPPSARVCHVPAGAAPGSIIISFRVDGITFDTWQKPVLENARFMAAKYGVVLDLAVIAKRTDSAVDPAVLDIYTMNQEAFEIIANGLTYNNDINRDDRGEFFNLLTKSPVAYEVQEQHIRDMRENLSQRGMYAATQVFIVPWGAGDEDTIRIAEKYGYRLIVQNTVPDGTLMQNYDSRIIVLNAGVGVPGSANDWDLESLDKRIQQLIDKNATRIQVVFSPWDFYTQENSVKADKFMYAITSIYSNPAIRFAKITDTITK